jgi:hypothetical protein
MAGEDKMKKNFYLIVFSILMMIVIFPACSTVGPTDPDRTPKPKSMRVDYSRIQPVPFPEARDVVGVNWRYEPSQGGVFEMTKTAEDTYFVAGISIMTETVIQIWVVDLKMWNGTSMEVCKTIKVDGQELVASSIYGQIKFIYGNDGKIRQP